MSDGVGQVVERQTVVVVAGVVAEVVGVGGKEEAASKLPQTVAPDLASPVHEAAVDPAAHSVDLCSDEQKALEWLAVQSRTVTARLVNGEQWHSNSPDSFCDSV